MVRSAPALLATAVPPHFFSKSAGFVQLTTRVSKECVTFSDYDGSTLPMFDVLGASY